LVGAEMGYVNVLEWFEKIGGGNDPNTITEEVRG